MSSPNSSPPDANFRKRSVARSYSSELGTVNESGEEEDCLCTGTYLSDMNENSVFDRSYPGQPILDTSSTLSGAPMQSIQTTPCPREVIKTKIRYHFMNPFQKFRARRRKPWKLVVQIVKIALVTLQICLFGFDRFSLVTFLENNQLALKHLFLKDYQSDDKVVVYTKDQLFNYLHHAHEQYYQVQSIPLGTYDYTHMNHSEPPRVQLCYSYYTVKGKESNPFALTDPVVDCLNLPRPVKHEHNLVTNKTFNLERLRKIRMMFSLQTVNLKDVKAWDKPACYKLSVTILFDNVDHDGRMPVKLSMHNTWLDCKNGEIKGSNTMKAHFIKTALVVFDVVVVSMCSLSLVLCGRSIYRSLKLAKEVAKFFKQDTSLEEFTFSDYQEFVSLWFFVIMTSDSLTIIGSIYKMVIDQRDSDYYNACSIFLGTAVLLVWIGLLRFLGYSKKYNVLLVTLKAATPSVLRFFVCVSLLFVGFMLCGWIVLGPFHPKFKTLTITAECLYSIVNGDDLFNTYAKIKEMKTPTITWIFSKIYLYIFIALFIYVVLSLFIGIIGDTYERLKDMGHLPETKVEKFLHEPANIGRSVNQGEYTSIPSSAEAVSVPSPPSQRRTTPYGRSRSSGTQDPMMRIVSIDSTGVE